MTTEAEWNPGQSATLPEGVKWRQGKAAGLGNTLPADLRSSSASGASNNLIKSAARQ